ncbi:MAG: FG-GAP repeat domain-containing protein, partial [Candidatus Thorarchaeota archaeon]
EVTTIDSPTIQNDLAADGNLLSIQLTAQSDYIATGNVTTYKGFAYSDDNADFLRFVDPINGITLNQSVETGTLNERSIAGADVDNDGSTEYLILNNNGTHDNLLLVDFNDALTTTYNVSIDSPVSISIGEFDGDTTLDAAIYGRFGVLTLDLQTDQVIGNFSVPIGDSLTSSTIGRFLEPNQDSIAFGIWPASKIANLSIVAGNGTLMRTMIFHNDIKGLAPFNRGSPLDDLAAIVIDGNLTTLSPSTMLPIFNTTGLPAPSHVWTGSFNQDTQEDLVVVPIVGVSNYTVFIDGTNGSIIRTSVVVYGATWGEIGLETPSALCDYGDIDADNITDLALLNTDSNPGFVSGADGTFGFSEPTISGKPNQIRVFDVNSNSKDDIFVLDGSFVHVLISDTEAPIITPEPLSPPHPTLHDPFIEIEVGVEDNSTIILADIYLRHEDGNWTQPVDELQNSGTQYFAFLVGMPEGDYDYYLVFQDAYLNIGTLGNQTHPMNFTVAGHLAWSDSKNLATGFEHQLMVIGNTSDGSEVIYILDEDMNQVWLERYTPRGSNQTLGLVASGIMIDYSIYTGMMDGDNILDPIILLFNTSSRRVNVTMFHGSSGTFWFSAEYPLGDVRSASAAQVYDCDNDGIDEFFFIIRNATTNEAFLQRLRADGSWSNVSITTENAEFYSLGLAKTINDNSVEACVSVSTGSAAIFNASSMTLISQHNVTRTGYTFTVPAGVYSFSNVSEPYSQFMMYMYFINGTGFSAGFQVFDANTPRINETTCFTINGDLFLRPLLNDVDRDGTDDIIAVNYFTGDLALIRLTTPAVIEWSVPISNSEFLGSLIVDFDGDGESEVGVFTKEDELLTIVSLDGIVERIMTVGQGYGSMRLSNIDLGYGEEIVAYPLVQNGVAKIGVIRDIVLIRRLNATLTYSSSSLLQSEPLSVYVDVTNIYSEIINDAEVFLTIHYMSGTSIVNQTQALIFETSNYTTIVAATWPIGVVDCKK